MHVLSSFSPILFDNIHKVGVAPLPEVLWAQRDEHCVIHAHSSSTPCLLFLLLQHLTQRRLTVVQGLQPRTEQAIQRFRVSPCRNCWGTLRIRQLLGERKGVKVMTYLCFGDRLWITLSGLHMTCENDTCVCGALLLGLYWEFYFFKLFRFFLLFLVMRKCKEGSLPHYDKNKQETLQKENLKVYCTL